MRSLKLVLQMTTVLVLCFPFISSADQTDQRLEGLFQTLQTSQDAEVLLEAEAAIWEIWYESGKEAIDNLIPDLAAVKQPVLPVPVSAVRCGDAHHSH